MIDAKTNDDRIERFLTKWQIFSITLTKFDVRIKRPRKLNLRLGKIQADSVSASVGGCCSDVAGTSCNIEHCRALCYSSRIEHGFGRLAR